MLNAAVLTISTSGAKGERTDTSGPNLVSILKNLNFNVLYAGIVTDDKEVIKNKLTYLVNNNFNLIITTGGTGFSKSDITPEATCEIIDKNIPGIPEIMRVKTFDITNRSILSRGIAGIKNESLIINLPGSKKAAEECFLVVKDAILHGLQILKTDGTNNCD